MGGSRGCCGSRGEGGSIHISHSIETLLGLGVPFDRPIAKTLTASYFGSDHHSLIL